MSTIERTDQDWGVRLTIAPFHTKRHQHLEIQADVHKPPPGQKQEVWVSFRGVAPQDKFRMTDARIWHAAMGAMLTQIEKVVDELAKKRKK